MNSTLNSRILLPQEPLTRGTDWVRGFFAWDSGLRVENGLKLFGGLERRVVFHCYESPQEGLPNRRIMREPVPFSKRQHDLRKFVNILASEDNTWKGLRDLSG